MSRPKRASRVSFTRCARAALALAALGALAACALQPIDIGNRPPTERLAGLVSQRSTAAQVRAALGEPRGRGLARYAPGEPVREVWHYELVRFKGDQAALAFLLVFLDGDRYDGHLWFSANELLDVGPG